MLYSTSYTHGSSADGSKSLRTRIVENNGERSDCIGAEREKRDKTLAHLLAVPAGTHSAVVMANGDPAEGAEQGGDLHVEDVDEPPLKLPPLQEHLPAVLQPLGAVHDDVDLGVGASAPDVPCHHLDIVHNAWWIG